MAKQTSLARIDTITKIAVAIVSAVGVIITALLGIAAYFKSPSPSSVQTATQSGTSPGQQPTATAASRPLRGLSNLQLRDATFDLVMRMRTFEANADSQMLSLLTRTTPREATEEQRRAAWEETTRRTLEITNQKKLEFSNRYLGQAREIKDELTLRMREIGIFPPYIEPSLDEQIGARLFDTGFIAGAQPISSMANYLEKLARRLPPT
jgi:hypothetical protein